MATQAQTIANRRNSQKSTGPRSPEGKAVVSKNAVKHGLFASLNVIKAENREEFDLFHDKMLSEMDPVGAMESFLAERVISLSWRLNRVGLMQNQAIDVMMERDGPSPLTKQLRASLPKFLRDVQDDPRGSGPELVLGRAVIKDYTNSRVLDRLLMYERRIESSMLKITDQLLKLRLMRELEEAEICGAEPALRDEAATRLAKNPGAPGFDLKKQRQSPAFGRKSEARNPKSEAILQNKANLIGAEMGANSLLGERYENKTRPGLRENKAKQSQFKNNSGLQRRRLAGHSQTIEPHL